MRIIYIDIDSLRPDHLGCYGYRRNTSPNIDRIAAEGVCFGQVYAASSPCVPSRASLLSGRFGVNHGALTHWGPGSAFRVPGEGHRYWPDAPLLTRFLREHGYRTASFSSFADRHLAFWFGAGWAELHTHTLKQGDENADEVNAAALPWLRAHGTEPDYFLHLQYWDPHRNYTVDRRWVDLVAGEPAPPWPDAEAIEGHRANFGPFSAAELFPHGDGRSPVPTMPDQIAEVTDATTFVNGYDGAIRFLDDQLGRVFDTLDELGVLDETAVVISADHGEAMGEHGIYGDHVCADEAVHHIPLIVKWPGMPQAEGPRRGLAYNVDLHPTVCELLGIPVPAGWDGVSMAGAVRGEAWPGRPALVWDHALYTCQRAVRTADWLYVRTYHPGLFPFEQAALYDIDKDVHQTRNVAAERTDVTTELDATLRQWHRSNTAGTPSADPMLEVLRTGGPFRYVDPDLWVRRLSERGRPAAAEQLTRQLDMAASVDYRDGQELVR